MAGCVLFFNFGFFSFSLSFLHCKIVLGFICISIIDQDGIFARTRGLNTSTKKDVIIIISPIVINCVLLPTWELALFLPN